MASYQFSRVTLFKPCLVKTKSEEAESPEARLIFLKRSKFGVGNPGLVYRDSLSSPATLGDSDRPQNKGIGRATVSFGTKCESKMSVHLEPPSGPPMARSCVALTYELCNCDGKWRQF